jgi:Flp pilus assembly protein TadG
MRKSPGRFTRAAIRQNRPERGSALIELSLLAPWLFFLFVGVVDLGFFTYDLIAVENATRIAAEHTSQSTLVQADQAGACTLVRTELAMVPNATSVANCEAAPLVVTATGVTGPDGNPATSVTVTYNSAHFIPIPLLLKGNLTISRNVQMRVQP